VEEKKVDNINISYDKIVFDSDAVYEEGMIE